MTPESEEELKSLLIKVKEECGKVGLKISIKKTKIMATGPITSWQIDGETVETVRDYALISHASKVMLKIFQARLQQYVNCELSDVQAGFRKGRGTRDKLSTSTGSWKKQESSRKTSISALLTMSL